MFSGSLAGGSMPKIDKQAFYDNFRRKTSSTADMGSGQKLRKNKISGLIGAHNQARAGRKQSKVSKMMTSMPDDIAKRIFTSGELILAPMDYSILWNSVSPARYITRCIKFLLDYEKSPEDIAKTFKMSATEVRYFVTCVLHSITVFDLFSVMVCS
jgi:hypothetical protein